MGKKQTTTVRNDPFSGEMKKKYDDFYPYLKGRMDKPPQYEGPYTADLSDAEKQGIGSLRDLANTSFLRDTMSGKYLDPASNPYLAKTADVIGRRLGEQFGQATDAIDSRVNRQGFWGGSAHQGMMERSRGELADRQGEALNSLYGNAYNSERDRQFQALGSAGNLGQALLGAGGVERGVADADLRRRYEAWMADQGLQQQDIGNLLNYFNVGRNPTNTQTSNDGGAGLGSIAGSLWGASIAACFAAGTPVAAPAGARAIETVQPGDMVISRDRQGAACAERVVGIAGPDKERAVIITAGGKTLVTTASQGMYTPAGIKLAADLAAGDELLTAGGAVAVDDIERTETVIDVYDLTVAGRNIFFADGFMVEGGF